MLWSSTVWQLSWRHTSWHSTGQRATTNRLFAWGHCVSDSMETWPQSQRMAWTPPGTTVPPPAWAFREDIFPSIQPEPPWHNWRPSPLVLLLLLGRRSWLPRSHNLLSGSGAEKWGFLWNSSRLNNPCSFRHSHNIVHQILHHSVALLYTRSRAPVPFL